MFKHTILVAAVAGLVFALAGTAQANTLYWDTNDTAAGFGNTLGTWGTDNWWNQDSTGGSGSGGFIAVPTASTDVLYLNYGDLSPFTMSVSGNVYAKQIVLSTAKLTTTINNGGSGVIHLYFAGEAITGASGDTTLNINVPIVLEQTAGSTVKLSSSSGNNSSGSITGKISSTNSVNLILNRGGGESYGAIDIKGTLATSVNNVSKSKTITISGNIGSGVTDVTHNATNNAGYVTTLLLQGNNTYIGKTTVTRGVIKAGSTTAFGTNSPVTLANTTDVALNLAGFNNSIGSLTGGGATGGNVTLGAATLTVGGDGTSPAAYAGVISSTGSPVTSLIKIGGGTQTLSGNNTYTGNTTISNGTLALTGSGAIANSPTIDVALGAIFDVSTVTGGYTLGASQTLKGKGTVTGPMTVAGTLSPGASIGTITVTGNATLSGTFSVDVETDGTSDLLAVTGTGSDLTLGGALFVVDTLKLKWPYYTIATYTGKLYGSFASTNLGTTTYSVDTTFTPGSVLLVPEPATLALLGLGGLGVILGRKRR